MRRVWSKERRRCRQRDAWAAGLRLERLEDRTLPSGGTPLASDLTGVAFRVITTSQELGHSVAGTFLVANRGGSQETGFSFHLVLSTTDVFDGSQGQAVTVPAFFTPSPPRALGPGHTFEASFAVRLPDSAPAGFPATGTVFLGLVIDPGANDGNRADKSGVRQGLDWDTLQIKPPSGSNSVPGPPKNARPIAPSSQVAGSLAAGQIRYFRIDIPPTPNQGNQTGLLTAGLVGAAPGLQLTLYDALGILLAQSDGAAGGAAARIAQHLQSDTYYLSVTSLGGAASFHLSTAFTPAQSPFERVGGDSFYGGPVTVADVNGDGRPDLLELASYPGSQPHQVLHVELGSGDGTFGDRVALRLPAQATSMLAGDFNGDGKPDLLLSGPYYPTSGAAGFPALVLLPGNGDGTFGSPAVTRLGFTPAAQALADVRGDGKPDLLLLDQAGHNVRILPGDGHGRFSTAASSTVSFAAAPSSLVAADVNGDGKPDLVVTYPDSNSVGVRLNSGNGTFGAIQTIRVGNAPAAVAVADLNGDGKPDLVVANHGSSNVGVLLGQGDGTFARQQTFATGTFPTAVMVADLNGDGKPDLVSANQGGNTVSVLLGTGRGAFLRQRAFAAGPSPAAVTAVDVNGDGKPDLVATDGAGATVLLGNGDGTFPSSNQSVFTPRQPEYVRANVNRDRIGDLIEIDHGSGTVSVLLGNAHGSFQEPVAVTGLSGQVYAATTADVTGDGKPDLIVTTRGRVNVLPGNGDGTFGAARSYAAGPAPVFVTTADVNADGRPDLVVTDSSEHTISVLLNEGHGIFAPRRAYGGLARGSDLTTVADVNGDGRPDLVVSDGGASQLSVLLNRGDGTFGTPFAVATGLNPGRVSVADVNGDGQPDLVVTNYHTGAVLELLRTGSDARGNPQFSAPTLLSGGSGPYPATVTADVNGDGRPDLVVANRSKNSVSVFPGNGDGTFAAAQSVPAGTTPVAVAVADLNNDGRLDLVVADAGSDTVAVLLGNGDGSFRPAQFFDAGAIPSSVAIADLNGDGKPDLVVADSGGNAVSVLPGNGDGTFARRRSFAAGSSPGALVVQDVNNDHKADVVVANPRSGTVSVLFGNGKGALQTPRTFSVGPTPNAVAVADVNGDHEPDLLATSYTSATLTVLLNRGQGTFRALPAVETSLGQHPPRSLTVADVTGDGRPDVVVADYDPGNNLGEVSLLPGSGNGTFGSPRPQQTSSYPGAVSVADLNGDGILDVGVVYNNGSPDALLNRGGGDLIAGSAGGGVGVRNTPLLGDFNHDGLLDEAILGPGGVIRFLAGQAGGGFASPVVINPGNPARALAVLKVGSQDALVAADAEVHFAPPALPFYPVSRYFFEQGRFQRDVLFTTIAPESRIVTGDLTGSGVQDVVTLNSLGNGVNIKLLDRPRAPVIAPHVGTSPSDLALADVNGDGRLDIVTGDQTSGDVSVLLNDPGHTFARWERFRAGLGPYGLATTFGIPIVTSQDQLVSLATGDFTGAGRADLAVVDRGTLTITVLQNDGRGGYFDPTPGMTTSTTLGLTISNQPGPVVAGDFNRDGKLDLAILMLDRGEVWIFLGDGHGRFTFNNDPIVVGTEATSLAVDDSRGLGLLDLLVGSSFGDVRRLVGLGNGHFVPPPPFTGNHVPLDVEKLQRTMQPEALLANQEQNHVTILTTAGGRLFTRSVPLAGQAQDTVLAPGAVQWYKLEDGSSPFFDAIVLASGSNEVLVYRATGFNAAGQPTFAAPASYPVGTNPDGVTIADLNGDGVPDMIVANQGSNDLSTLFGSIDSSGAWVGTAGPRLNAGGRDPIATTLADVNGDGIPDLLVTNSQSSTFTVLPGRGQGFFDDRNPQTITVAGNPGLLPPTPGGGGNLIVGTGDGGLLGLNLNTLTVETLFSPSPGEEVATYGTLSNGDVVAALDDGTVEELKLGEGEASVEGSFEALNGSPPAPSALQVLQSASGLEILVTSAGLDTIFVFTPPPESPSPGPSPEPKAVATTLEGAPLVLIVTLQPAPLGEAESAAGGPALAGGLIGPTNVGDPVKAAAVGGEDEQEAPVQLVALSEGGGVGGPSPALEEALRRLELYRPPAPPPPPGPLSRRTQPGREEGLEEALSELVPPAPAPRPGEAASLAEPAPTQTTERPAEAVPLPARAEAEDVVAPHQEGAEPVREAAPQAPRRWWLLAGGLVAALAGGLGPLWRSGADGERRVAFRRERR